MSPERELLPNYEVVPLRREEIRVGVVPSAAATVDPGDAPGGRMKNVEHLCWLIDQAQGHGVRREMMKDLIVFHESPIAGWNVLFSRDQQVAISIDVPGPETDALAAKARQYNCYVAFGSYARDKDWPGHYVNMGILIGPKGDILLKNWKKRNMPGRGNSTAVYDVLKRFVDLYGWDQVFPVARTDIGNICFVPCIFEPEFTRCFALKGAEIYIRYMTAGLPYRFDVPAQCYNNKIYGIFVNQPVNDHDIRVDDVAAGGSAVYDDSGRLIAEATSHHETVVSANIPLAAFRKRHSIPIVCKDLFMPVYEAYTCKYPPNAYLEYLPKDKQDTVRRLQDIARW